MTQRISFISEVAEQFDVIVLDQWGVLHDGSVPYPDAINSLAALKALSCRLAVLSNSGKRAIENTARISAMGYAPELFEIVMTSGEALWLDIEQKRVLERVYLPIERVIGDASVWGLGLDVSFVNSVEKAEAVLLMGLPDEATETDFEPLFGDIQATGLPIICTNPDRYSPRTDGQTVLSPGTLASKFSHFGGDVRFYGKPYQHVFQTLEAALNAPPERLLMVGDSLEHDILGAHAAGWSTCFVEGGLYSKHFENCDPKTTLQRLVAESGSPLPDYSIARLA